MAKIITFFLFWFSTLASMAQIPSGYYNSAMGKTGTELRIALHEIIDGHSSISYGELWSAYYNTDKLAGTSYVWDIYSNNPGDDTDYFFNLGSDQCSGTSATSEGYCYNREHTWPKSKYSSNPPMYTDLWIVYPTDAFVNSKRMDYPYGKVSSATWTSSNGSKLGANTYSGSPSTICFEPNDSFKGDIARSYFYISTRYYSEDGGWSNWEMANGADLKPWAKQMLLEWHHMDPVSPKEIQRNNAVYAIQNNRNPFIDYPEMADCVFGTSDCTSLLGTGSELSSHRFVVYPNPASESLHVNPRDPSSIAINTNFGYRIIDITGVVMMKGSISSSTSSTIDISHLPIANYILTISSSEGISHLKFTKN